MMLYIYFQVDINIINADFDVTFFTDDMGLVKCRSEC